MEYLRKFTIPDKSLLKTTWAMALKKESNQPSKKQGRQASKGECGMVRQGKTSKQGKGVAWQDNTRTQTVRYGKKRQAHMKSKASLLLCLPICFLLVACMPCSLLACFLYLSNFEKNSKFTEFSKFSNFSNVQNSHNLHHFSIISRF